MKRNAIFGLLFLMSNYTWTMTVDEPEDVRVAISAQKMNQFKMVGTVDEGGFLKADLAFLDDEQHPFQTGSCIKEYPENSYFSVKQKGVDNNEWPIKEFLRYPGAKNLCFGYPQTVFSFYEEALLNGKVRMMHELYAQNRYIFSDVQAYNKPETGPAWQDGYVQHFDMKNRTLHPEAAQLAVKHAEQLFLPSLRALVLVAKRKNLPCDPFAYSVAGFMSLPIPQINLLREPLENARKGLPAVLVPGGKSLLKWTFGDDTLSVASLRMR